MGRRKAQPQRGLGRIEDRSGLLAGGGGGGSEDEAAAAADAWRLAGVADSSDDEEDFLAQRAAKRRRMQRRRGAAAAGSDADAAPGVAVALQSAAELSWRFADLPVSWQPAASGSGRMADGDGAGGSGSLQLALQPDGSLEAGLTVGAAAWHGSLAPPGKEAATGLLSLLRSGHLSCGVAAAAKSTGRGSSGGSGAAPGPLLSLSLSLSDRAAAEAAEHPEDQQQRQWHRSLLSLMLGWLVPDLDPERELEVAAAAAVAAGAAAATAAELLSSPLCSPRAGAAQQPASPLSPTAGGGGGTGGGGPPAFDASELYAAVKPTGHEAELPAGTTDATLLPTLRRYQARAAQWMVDRERRGGAAGAAEVKQEQRDVREAQQQQQEQLARKQPAAGEQAADGPPPGALHPLWRQVACTDGEPFYLNPFSGQIALERFEAAPKVRGGILSDEMGLGKTVELLACITAHRFAGPPPKFEDDSKRERKRSKRERIDCLCSATSEEGYAGLWLQCDECNAWMHAACLGLRRAPPGTFVCGACQRAAAATAVLQDCGATLVVCPTPILHQWRDEILRHTKPGALKLVIYEGQPQPGAGRAPRVVTAAHLAAADIVLTTYDTLRHDVNHCPDTDGDGSSRSLRYRKKYEVVPTPLTRLRWWRVCLDEAQMVESSTARAAQMALKLQTVHCWCVTGTPLSRGLEDLYGLLAFLQAAPYSNRHWWQRAVQRPYEGGSRAARARLLALLRPALGGLLWRSAKTDVAHELGLPPQHHHLTQLQLSAIERHFYSRQHQDCVERARATLSPAMLAAAMSAAAAADGVEVVEARGSHQASGDGGGSSAGAAATAAAGGAAVQGAAFEDRALTRKEEASLLHPLLRLRQACCHPQVGGAGIKAVTHQRAPMTMGEVLEVMLTKARMEAEDAQRVLLASLNGLAGLLLLQGLPAEAVKAYREALALIDQTTLHVRADKLQQLHTLHNLAELLGEDGRSVAGVAPTLRDSRLKAQAGELREEYLAESAARLAAAGEEVAEVEAAMLRVKAPLVRQVARPGEAEGLLEGWYLRAVALFVQHGRDTHSQAAVADRIKEQLKEETIYLRSVSQNATTIASRFRDLHGLEMALKGELRELTRAQGEAMEELRRLQGLCQAPPPALVELAATCSRCRAETAVAGRVCRHCKLEELFWGWEGRAFALYSKAREGAQQVTAEEAIRQAQQAVLQGRVGRGGLGEAAAGGDEDGAHALLLGAGRRDEAVARTEIVRRPGDAENTLRLLLHQLRLLRVPPAVAAEKELIQAAGKVHLELLEQQRRLYLKARAASLTQRARLYALDELEQCTMRIKLLSDNELRQKEGEEIYRIFEHEVPIRSTELSNDKASAELELNRKLGTLRYLTGIKEREASKAAAAAAGEAAAAAGDGAQRGGSAADVADNGQPGTSAAGAAAATPGAAGAAAPACGAAAGPSAPRPAAAAAAGEEDREDICPICHDSMGLELVMLACAHRLCCRCCMVLQDRLPPNMPQPSRKIECPVCRTRVPVSELVYVDARLASPSKPSRAQVEEAADEEEEAIQVAGSYGTKLEAVVRRLLWLTRADAGNRVLVFSTWKDVLELISHALTANGLPHLHPRSSKGFEAAVADFRTGHAAAEAAAGAAGSSKAAGKQPMGSGRSGAPRVLLLLIKQGANGLNLTEAQHVVLAEPLLDPAVEAQAVGRVDRIGQRRSTHVHRFVVERTIEENVHRLCQQRAAAMDLSAASIKRGAGGQEKGGLTVRDVALLLRRPDNEEEVMEAEGDGDAELAGQAGQQQQQQRLDPRQAVAAAALRRSGAA